MGGSPGYVGEATSEGFGECAEPQSPTLPTLHLRHTSFSNPSSVASPTSHGEFQDQDQRSEPEAESQVQSTSDDVLHAVSIPAYETHRWKEDSNVLLT